MGKNKCEKNKWKSSRHTLLKQRASSESVYNNLFPQGSKPSILYGLPNVHKVNCPARSIMSAIGTFNYKLAKFLVPILQPLTCNQYTVHSSFSFVDEITQLTLSHDAVLVSFDVASLFTNIPLDETVNIILDNLFSGTDEVQVENCVFSKPQFKKLLEFAVKSNHFIFNPISMNKLMEWLWALRWGPVLLIYLCVLLNKTFFLTVHLTITHILS